jgi:hypothetical protein
MKELKKKSLKRIWFEQIDQSATTVIDNLRNINYTSGEYMPIDQRNPSRGALHGMPSLPLHSVSVLSRSDPINFLSSPHGQFSAHYKSQTLNDIIVRASRKSVSEIRIQFI